MGFVRPILQEAYKTIIDPAVPSEDKTAQETELLKYCRQDTQAMVDMVHFFITMAKDS